MPLLAVNVEEQSLELLIDHDEFPPDLPPRPFTLTSDGSALYFSTGFLYRFDLASGEIERISAAEPDCTDSAAAPYNHSRICEVNVVGDGAWLLISALDVDTGGVGKRSVAWIVNSETEETEEIFEVLAPGGGRLLDGSADGSRVVYQYSETSTEGGGLYCGSATTRVPSGSASTSSRMAASRRIEPGHSSVASATTHPTASYGATTGR